MIILVGFDGCKYIQESQRAMIILVGVNLGAMFWWTLTLVNANPGGAEWELTLKEILEGVDLVGATVLMGVDNIINADVDGYPAFWGMA